MAARTASLANMCSHATERVFALSSATGGGRAKPPPPPARELLLERLALRLDRGHRGGEGGDLRLELRLRGAGRLQLLLLERRELLLHGRERLGALRLRPARHRARGLSRAEHLGARPDAAL